MKFQILICLVVVLIALNQCKGLLKAQTKNNFSRSCVKIVLKGTDLTADCKDRNRNINQARLDLNKCFENNDGHLVHHRGGNYGKTCSNCSLIKVNAWNVDFKCTCKNRDGINVQTIIDINAFLDNGNGNLSCGRF